MKWLLLVTVPLLVGGYIFLLWLNRPIPRDPDDPLEEEDDDTEQVLSLQ